MWELTGYVTSVSTVFIYIGLLGLDKYANREIAYNRGNKAKLNETFSQLLILRIIMLIITVAIYIIFSVNSEYSTFLLIETIYVIAYLLDISWLYNGLEEFKITVLRSIIIKLINIICIIIFIKKPNDLWKYILINGSVLLLGNLSLYYHINKYVNFKNTKINNVFKHIPMTLQIFIPQLAIQLYLQLGKIMIKYITNNTVEIAYYDQADKIVKLPLALITALSTVMLPRLANEIKQNNKLKVKEYINKSLTFSFFLGIPIMIGIMGISDNLVLWLLGDEYIPVAKTIKILAPIILALCTTNVLGDQYLIASNKTKALTTSYIVGVTVNFLCNIFLIKRFSYIGAAISMVITEICIVTIQAINTKKMLEVKTFLIELGNFSFSGITMIIPINLISMLNTNSILITLLQILTGATLYFGVLILLKDNFFKYIIKSARGLIKKEKRKQ